MFNLLISLFVSVAQMLGTPAPEAQATEATIVFAGDAMQHQKQLDVARQPDGSYDYTGCFDEIAPYVKSADYAVVNLETTLGARNFTGYPCFCSPDAYARALQQAGFDMMLTANNHTLDRRDAGLRRTIDVLDSMHTTHLGTYRNRAERDSVLPLIVDIKGFKVGFLNYTYATNGITVQGNVVVDYINEPLIKSDIKRLRDAGAEIVAVNMHWGDEYKLLPNTTQRRQAKLLEDLGVDLVIGGHPHVIEPIEFRHNESTGRPTLVVWSMGNLISNMNTRDTRGGILVKVTLERDSSGQATLKAAEYLPVFTLPGVHPGNRQFRLVPVDTYKGAFKSAEIKAWDKSATNIFNTHNRGNVARSDFFTKQDQDQTADSSNKD